MHLDGLDFSGHTDGGEGDDHAGLDDTSLNTTDGHRADTANLVDILEGETEGLVGGTRWRLDGIDGIEQRLALNNTRLGLPGPTLVPGHAKNGGSGRENRGIKRIYSLGRLLQHVVAVPARDGHERDGLGVVTDLLDEGGRLLNDFVEAVLAPL